MANERFSIVEHLDWTHGKVSIYGKLYPLFDELNNGYDTYMTSLSDIESGTITDPTSVNATFNDSDSDDLYGNNKTIRVFFESMPVLGISDEYNDLISGTSTLGTNEQPGTSSDHQEVIEPHINLKKNQEIGVYISPLVDMRTPIKDFVNIFDPGSSNSNVYYRATLNPPKITPDHIIEPTGTTSQAYLIPDKYSWRPDTFNHPLQEKLVHTWPLHYEDTYLDDVQSGRHLEISPNLISLRNSNLTMGEWISNIEEPTDITSLLNDVKGDFGTSILKHIVDYHWIVKKTWNVSINTFSLTLGLNNDKLEVNKTLNPFADRGLDILSTYIPDPQSKMDLIIKMFNPTYCDLNGHLVNYYDAYGNNREQYMIFNDVFEMYGKDILLEEFNKNALSSQSIPDTINAETNSINTEIDISSIDTYVSYKYGDIKEYVNYLKRIYAIKGLDTVDDSEFVILPKEITRVDESNLPSNKISPTGNLKIKNYEDELLTGYFDGGSYEQEPLSTGDGDLSIAFSLRNIDGGTIMSTGAEIEGETGIHIELKKQANTSIRPLAPYEYNLNLTIKSTNYKYNLNDLNFYENANHHDFGFGLFRPVASIQRPTGFNYTYSTHYNDLNEMESDGLLSGTLTSISNTIWEKYYNTDETVTPSLRTLKDIYKNAYKPNSINNEWIDQDRTKPTGKLSDKSFINDWINFSWTNILITKKESVEFVKIPKYGDDKSSWELILDENGNKITNYLDAKLWLLNNFESAILEEEGWSGDIGTRPLEFSEGLYLEDIKELVLERNTENKLNVLNLRLRYYDASQELKVLNFDVNTTQAEITDTTANVNLFVDFTTPDPTINLTTEDMGGSGNKIGSFVPVGTTNKYVFDFSNGYDISYGIPNHFVEVFASYKNDDDVNKYVYLGRNEGVRMDQQEGSNTNLYIGRANLDSKQYFKGHLKDIGIWYKYLNPISTSTVLNASTTPLNNPIEIEHIWVNGSSSAKLELDDASVSYQITNTGGLTANDGLDLTELFNYLVYSNMYYVLNYDRTQYLSDLSFNVQTTKWTKYPFKIAFNSDRTYPSLNWYNRQKSEFDSNSLPKEKVVNMRGYRTWQSKVLLKL